MNTWNEMRDTRPDLADAVMTLSLLPQRRAWPHAMLGLLLDQPAGPDGSASDEMTRLVRELIADHLLERPSETTVRLNPPIWQVAREHGDAGFAARLAARVSSRLYDANVIAALTGNDWILLRDVVAVLEWQTQDQDIRSSLRVVWCVLEPLLAVLPTLGSAPVAAMLAFEARRRGFDAFGTATEAAHALGGLPGLLFKWSREPGTDPSALHRFIGHTDIVKCCTIAPDGRLALSGGSGSDPSLRVWEIATGTCLAVLEGHARAIWSCAFSPDSRLAVSAGDDALRVWDVGAGTCRAILNGHTDSVHHCTFSTDGRRVFSAASDNTVRVWDVASGVCLRTAEGRHRSYMTVCQFSSDRRLALAGYQDGTLRVWDMESCLCQAVLEGHADVGQALEPNILRVNDEGHVVSPGAMIRACAFSPDDRLALSASEDGTLRIWDVESGLCTSVLRGHDSMVVSCAFSPDGRLALSGARNGTLRVWDVATGICRTVMQGDPSRVEACRFLPDGRMALATSGHRLRLWDVASGACMSVFGGHTGPIFGLAVSPDGHIALSASVDSTLRAWKLAAGKSHDLCKSPDEERYDTRGCCAISSNGQLAASAGWNDMALRIWDVSSGALRRELAGHADDVSACALSLDGRFALSGSHDGTLRLWDVMSGDCCALYEGPSEYVSACAVSPNGRFALLASDDNVLRVWDVTSGNCTAAMEGHGDVIRAVDISANGHLAISASQDRTLRVWDLASGSCSAVLEGHVDGVFACAFSSDGRWALSASSDNTLRLWDVVSGAGQAVLEGHKSSVHTCVFSPDGRLAISVSYDDQLRLWDIASRTCCAVLHIERATGMAWHQNSRSTGITIVDDSGCAFYLEPS